MNYTKKHAKVKMDLSLMTLEGILKQGAQDMLKCALTAEIDAFIERYSALTLENGQQRVVKNGYQKERNFMTPIGNISINVPRAEDRHGEIKYSSNLIPPYLRRVKQIDEFIPYLYLKGVSTGDFSGVLSKLLGEDVSLSAGTVVRLKEKWLEEYRLWGERDLSEKCYVYWWVDGIYFNVRLEDERSCILVIMGADETGKKELIFVESGFRESYLSWKEILLKLKARGLTEGPMLATGDGALGFWKALREVYPETKEQRCWVHKTANVLDKLPKSLQKQAKRMLHEIYLAPTKKEAEKAFETFIGLYEAKYPKAVQCLLKSKKETMAFYDFPAEHWRHIRSSNPIESTFATVRLRTKKTKGCGSRNATLMMVFKLVQSAEKRWQKLHSHAMISLLFEGKIFEDGVLKKAA